MNFTNLVEFSSDSMFDYLKKSVFFLQVEAVELKTSKKEYSPGIVDDAFLNVFRGKMAQVIINSSPDLN